MTTGTQEIDVRASDEAVASGITSLKRMRSLPYAAGKESYDEFVQRLLKDNEQRNAKARQMAAEALKESNRELAQRIRDEAGQMNAEVQQMVVEAYPAAVEQKAKQLAEARARSAEQKMAASISSTKLKLRIEPNPQQPLLPEVKANEKSRIRSGKKKPARKPGVVMSDETIFGGVSKQDGTLIFTTPADAKGDDGENLTMTFNDAAAYVDAMNKSNAFGHNDWHLATPHEMRVLLDNERKGALKDSFNLASPHYIPQNQLDMPGIYWLHGDDNNAPTDDDGNFVPRTRSMQACDKKVLAYPVDEKFSVRIVRTVNADGTQPGVTSETHDTQFPKRSAKPDGIVKQSQAKELTSAEIDAIQRQLNATQRRLVDLPLKTKLLSGKFTKETRVERDRLNLEIKELRLLRNTAIVAPYRKEDGTLDVRAIAHSPYYAEIIAMPGMAAEFTGAALVAREYAVQHEAVKSAKAKKCDLSQKFFG